MLSNRGKPLVYLDKVLMGSDSRLIISRFFEFDPEAAVWRGVAIATTQLLVLILIDYLRMIWIDRA